jgi:hypothetical protein
MPPSTRSLLSLAVISTLFVTPARSDSLVAFVTSVTGTGDLSTWPDSGGQAGLAGGDAICHARASAAGLASASPFVAWLSDSSDDAYCRVHGLSGKVADDCGQAELPTWAGPWMRTDGYPFGATIGDLVGGTRAVMTTLSITEAGTVTTEELVFTGSTPEGALSGSSPCSDWTDGSAVSVAVGRTDLTGNRWSNNGTATCHIAKPLFCFQSGQGDPLPALPRNGALAFMTAVTGKGRLQDWADANGLIGVAAGDAICQARASAASLSNSDSFLAWLSDDQEHVALRFSFDGPWIRQDGVPVASTLADLTDGNLFAPLNMDPNGNFVSAQWAWTGSSDVGLYTSQDCNHWTSDNGDYSGTRGFVIAVQDEWTDSWDEPCGAQRALYCFAQVPLSTVFVDGFESGTLDEWDG